MIRARLSWCCLAAGCLCLAAAGCQSRSYTTARAGGPADALEVHYVSGTVAVSEGDVVVVKVINAGDGEQECVIEIYTAKGDEIINTRGEATHLDKKDAHRLNGYAVGTTSFTTKSGGSCWVKVRTNSAEVVPQLSVGRGGETRVTYKPGDFVKVERGGSGMYGRGGYGGTAKAYGASTGYSRGETKPAGPRPTGAGPVSTAPKTTGRSAPSTAKAPPPPALDREVREIEAARREAEAQRRQAELLREQADAARRQVEEQRRQAEEQLRKAKEDLERLERERREREGK